MYFLNFYFKRTDSINSLILFSCEGSPDPAPRLRHTAAETGQRNSAPREIRCRESQLAYFGLYSSSTGAADDSRQKGDAMVAGPADGREGHPSRQKRSQISRG